MTFKQLNLSPEILQNLEKLGFTHPTEIQQQAIPFIVENTNDLIALAQTGTGKTAAFGLPIIDAIQGNEKFPKALILCPTRELAIQIAKELNMYVGNSKRMEIQVVYGGANISTQISQLRRGCDILVGTPGRTLDLLNRKELKLHEVEYFILDEADEMLNMGFKDELDDIISHLPEEKQTLLFSATFPQAVSQLAKAYLVNPHQITIGTKNSASKQITHQYCVVKASDKVEAVKRIIDSNPDLYAIAFCRTKMETQEVAGKLIDAGYNADCIHGDLSQSQRETIIRKFRKKSIKVLVATDVVARGLDINNLTHVLNLNLPDDPEVYIHRSGRTGRAGKTGISICIIHSREHRKLREIAKINKLEFNKILLPSGMEICQDLLLHHIAKVQEAEVSNELGFLLNEVQHYFEDLSKEEIVAKFVSQTFNQMLNKYKNTSNINIDLSVEHQEERREKSSKRERGRSREKERDNHRNEKKDFSAKGKKGNVSFERIKINVGKNQNFKRAKIFEIINRSDARGAEVGNIDIQSNVTYLEVDKRFATQIAKSLQRLNNDTTERKPSRRNKF